MKETYSIKNKYKSFSFIGKITRVDLYHSIRINTCNDLIFPKLLKTKFNINPLAEIYQIKLTCKRNNK